MKKLVLLFAALLVAGCGEKLPDDPEIKQALKNAVWGKDLEWRDEEGLVTHERQLKESSDGRRTYTMGWGIDRLHLRGESEPYSGWVKLTAEFVFMNYDHGHKEKKDPEAVRGLFRVKGGHREGRVVSWFRNGQIKSEGFSVAGKPHGLHTQWHENGQKSGERTYKDGKKVETHQESKK